MIGIGKYPGDERVKELLSIRKADLSFAELRAAVGGAIFAVENVPPSQLFSYLFGEEDEPPSFTNESETKEWFSCVMGLWNEMTKFQEKKNPFLFSEWPNEIPGEKNELLQLARIREKEIERFLWGLRRGNTPFSEDFEDPTPEDLLSWTPLFLNRHSV